LRFWDNVANYEPMGASRRQKSAKAPSGTGWLKVCSPSTKPSVGHTGHVLAQTCTHNQTGGFEHFWHP
jgi:hypothetical protein